MWLEIIEEKIWKEEGDQRKEKWEKERVMECSKTKLCHKCLRMS